MAINEEINLNVEQYTPYPVGASRTTTIPKMDGEAAVGSEYYYAAGDHVHPSDTSRIPMTAKGEANGVCPLDSSARINDRYLPASVATEFDAVENGLTALSARVDAISTLEEGSTTGDAELIDGRVGADASTYSNIGTAIRSQIRGIQNSLYNREFNVFDFVNKSNKTSPQGATFTWNEDGTCTITGTTTAWAHCPIFYNLNGFPPFIRAGQRIQIKMESDNDESVVSLEVYRCVDGVLGSKWLTITPDTQGDGTYQATIPSGLSGILFRIRVKEDVTYNETVRVSLVPIEATDNVWGASAFTSADNDLDTLTRNGVYFMSASSTHPVTNTPYNPTSAFWVDVKCVGDKTSLGVLQITYPWGADVRDPYFRVRKSGVWTDWKKLGTSDDSGGDIYIQNTYNITTSPTITTDANGWLQPIDEDTEDETNKTDMTGAIMSMLTDVGYCHLAEGIYYVTGNIDMPYGSTLEGCGQNTIIRLLSDVEGGYCVKPTRYSTIRGIRFSGGYDAFEPIISEIGERNGVVFVANADGEEASKPNIEQCVIDNCWFQNFNGSAIFCHNTGGSVHKPLVVTNCYMENCGIGINIDYYSEYQKYVNVVTRRCYYACINNGGNNVFVSCTFHGTVGFSMDGLKNNAHGSCIGCTFNHIDNWNRPETLGGGLAIDAKNISNGFIFTGCQIWYGAISVSYSRGIALSDCLIGGNPAIVVDGNYPAFFSNCIFHATPSLDVNEETIFNNCYLDLDGSPIGA